MQQHSPSRRALLGALAALALVPLSACGEADPRPSSSPSSPVATSASAGSTGPTEGVKPFAARFKELERSFDARLGVYAVDTGTGREVAYNDRARFAFASTFKAFAAGAVLRKDSVDGLDEVVTYSRDDLVSNSPVSEKHVGTGMNLGALCDAAVRFSDNTAANLLLDRLGGPGAWTPCSPGSATTSPGWNTRNRNSTSGRRVPWPTPAHHGHSRATCARSSSGTCSARTNAHS